MDEKDFTIINCLKQNSRLSVREISKLTSIRPSTVHQRIKALKKEKVIEKFTVKTKNESVDEGFIVFMLIKTKPNVQLGNKFFGNMHIKEVFGVTGEYDLLVKMKFKDVAEFNNFIIKFRKEEQVESTLTMVGTVNLKEEL